MLVYDITNEKSFENIRNWVRNIEEVISAFTYSILKLLFSLQKYIEVKCFRNVMFLKIMC